MGLALPTLPPNPNPNQVRSLALGLRDECAPAGVAVACLLPGATATEFARVGGTELGQNQGPMWPARAAQAAHWPKLAGALGSLRHALALTDASGAPADRSLSLFAFDIGTEAAMVFNLPLGLGRRLGVVRPYRP